ncbi:hypothetical protein BDV35DRAFT_342844 [Aspergillus flavus]|uniref:Uncharacterized protein n=1 Tax=Aspergillus flavus TaxID=5059 RepID=A0A5N6H777_ASPFL|nr:hypothetical protein BDV35DRAFT_342844 [Aspergillus flavus]
MIMPPDVILNWAQRYVQHTRAWMILWRNASSHLMRGSNVWTEGRSSEPVLLSELVRRAWPSHRASNPPNGIGICMIFSLGLLLALFLRSSTSHRMALFFSQHLCPPHPGHFLSTPS